MLFRSPAPTIDLSKLADSVFDGLRNLFSSPAGEDAGKPNPATPGATSGVGEFFANAGAVALGGVGTAIVVKTGEYAFGAAASGPKIRGGVLIGR